jgi:hypothetical protein
MGVGVHPTRCYLTRPARPRTLFRLVPTPPGRTEATVVGIWVDAGRGRRAHVGASGLRIAVGGGRWKGEAAARQSLARLRCCERPRPNVI